MVRLEWLSHDNLCQRLPLTAAVARFIKLTPRLASEPKRKKLS